jgi:sulfite reductase beta subunit-like hemoprotein
LLTCICVVLCCAQAVETAFQRAFELRAVSGCPRECGVLRAAMLELAGRVKKLLGGLARNQETANTTYHSQLKKMREVCNQSIRSAIQVCIDR